MPLFTRTRSALALAGLLATTISSAAMAEGTLRLDFGVYSSNKPSAMVKVYKPLLKELEQSMSKRLDREVDIRMQIAKDYDQGISNLAKGRVDFSIFGPASYLEAKRMNQNIDILAVENVNNSKVFYGIIAVAKDSPIKSIQELRGKSFAFGSEVSTIGRFLSQLELEQAGIHAGDLSKYEYLGRHDKVGTAVGAGSFDAGALNEKTFKKLVEAGEDIRELVRFPNVTKPWIAREGLDDDVIQALRQSLLEVDNPKTLASLKIHGFLEGNDDDYKVIRKAMENNDAFFEESIVVNDVNTASTPAEVEPGLQAAQADAAASEAKIAIESSNTNNVQPQAVRQYPADNRFVTVNITLPRSMFDADNTTGPNTITINLMSPEEAIDRNSVAEPAR